MYLVQTYSLDIVSILSYIAVIGGNYDWNSSTIWYVIFYDGLY